MDISPSKSCRIYSKYPYSLAARTSGSRRQSKLRRLDHLRLTRNNSAKELISKYAADCIPNNSTVFISVGTTMETFARIMKDKKNMRYITNSIFIAGILRQNPENEIFLPSGRLNNSNGAVYGESSMEYLSQFFPDFHVMSSAAITPEGKTLAHMPEEIASSRKIRAQSERSFFLFDQSKLNQKGNVYSCDITEFTDVFTDAVLPPQLDEILKANNTAYHFCK